MAGVFPPPVHGVAAVNAAMRRLLHESGGVPTVIDLAAPSLDRALAVRLGRLPKAVRGLGRLAQMPALRGAALYMSVSGGWGQAYELLFAGLGRLRGMRIYLHHNSFAYLDRRSGLFALLARVAGRSAVHIALSPGMSDAFRARYGAARLVPISNSAFIDSPGDDAGAVARARPRTLGYFSNIAPEKGVFEFLDLLAAARDAGLPVRGVLAGAFQDGGTERRVRERLSALADVEYVGPKYGGEKYAFLDGTDVLVFPTRYRNEAEPLVIHEAMSRNVPVIAYGRGCIPEIVGPECGLVVDPAAAFVPTALERIATWLADATAFEAASLAAGRRFRAIHAENRERLQVLVGELTGRGPELAQPSSLTEKPSAGR